MLRRLALSCLLLLLLVPPASARDLPAADVALLGAALKLADAGKGGEARALAAQASDPLVRDLVLYTLASRRDPPVTFAEIAGLLERHPDWPRRQLLAGRAEALMQPGLSPGVVAAWFQSLPPQSGTGALAETAALVALGRQAEARSALQRSWRSVGMTETEEAQILAAYGAWLTPEDQAARLAMLLDAGSTADAARQVPRVGGQAGQLGAARLALQNRSKNALTLVEKLPGGLRSDPGLVVDLAQFYQRTDRLTRLDELLLSLGPANAGRAQTLWPLRFAAVKRLMRGGQAQTAYRIARDNGLSDGTGFAELEWFAGYIALRRLGDPAAALVHFTRYYEGTNSPISLGKAGYWAAAAAEAQGKNDLARSWLQRAAQQGTAFYGQLAAARLGLAPGADLPAMPALGAAAYKPLRESELARAAIAFNGAGDRDRTALFLRHMVAAAKDQSQYLAVGRLAQDLGRWDLVVAAGKAARSDGFVLVDYLFPRPPLPAAKVPETALVYALIRQESEFNQTAISRADARGLMQLLPGTAQGVAKRLGLAYSLNRLTSDPDYNVTLGRAYLAGLLDQFKGSYLLALAGYNAGPKRAGEWIGRNGDPRAAGTDLVEWIEAIPFDETRNYVMRVSEALLVYRHLLGHVQVKEWVGYNPASGGPEGARLPACCGRR